VAADLARARGKKLISKKRGATRKLHKPCINVIQTVVIKKDGELRACKLHSPAHAMAKGNWATYLSVKKLWNLYCCGQVGEKLRGSDADLQSVVDSIQVISKVGTNDDAGVNKCVSAQEQTGLED